MKYWLKTGIIGAVVLTIILEVLKFISQPKQLPEGIVYMSLFPTWPVLMLYGLILGFLFGASIGKFLKRKEPPKSLNTPSS